MLSSEDAKKDPDSKRDVSRASPSSQRSHRQGSKESPSRRKSKKQKKRTTDDSNRSKRQQKNDSTDGCNSARQKKNTNINNNNNNNSMEKCSGEIIGSSRTARKSAESTDRRSSRREKNRSAEKIVESKLQKVKRIFSGEKIEAPKDNHLCSDTFGYGPEFLDSWLEEPQTIEFKVEPPKKVPVVKVSKTLIIYEVPKELSTKIEIGDILYKFNDLPLTTRDEYTRQLSFVMKMPDSQTLTYTVLRPIKSKQIPEKELSDVFSKLQQPQGFEILPTNFDYLFVFLTIAPKTTLGVTIKGYNGKVYVSGIENKLTSIAYKCLLVGDAILAIEDQALSGVKDTDELLCTSFSKKKFVRLIIERAKNPDGLRNVKLALSVEKTFEINPRMTEDVTDICQKQITFMKKHPELKPDRRIVHHHHHSARTSTSHVDVASESVEDPISTDVNNIALLAPTPPVPGVPAGTVGSYNPLESNMTNSKRMLKKRTTK